MLELRVPKLIVRKVVVQEGDGKTETMEIYSPDKSKKLCEYEENLFIPDPVPVEEKQRKRVLSRRSSRTSSVASHESLNHNKKRKKKTRLESSSSDENAGEKILKHGKIRYAISMTEIKVDCLSQLS